METRRSNGSAGSRVRRVDRLIEEPVEPGVALPECERLAGSKVDWSDYPERTPARERVYEILDVIEDALARGDEERLERIAKFADPIQGFGGKGDPIRWELSRVEKAASRLLTSKRPELTALKLIFDLEISDPRYGTLDPAFVVAQLRSCKPKTPKKGGPGRGNRRAPGTLASLMLQAGAHGVEDISEANRKIDNARTSSKQSASGVRPSEFRRLREK